MKTQILRLALLILLLFSGVKILSARLISSEKIQTVTDKERFSGTSGASVSLYDAWLSQDVKWIITDPERSAFKMLQNDTERQYFVESFWGRRDPTDDTVRNEFKDAHYQRMLTARQRFSAPSTMGWDTPQGRIYVMYGPPDNVKTNHGPLTLGPLTLGPQHAILGMSCDVSSAHPVNSYETWHYDHIRGIDHPVSITFAELCKTGESVAVVDKADAGWLSAAPVPKYRLECNGKYDPNNPPPGLQVIDCLGNPPPVHFKELEEIVTSHVRYNLVLYEVHVSSTPITDATSMLRVTMTIKNSDLTCSADNGAEHAPVRVFGRFTTPAGRVARTFEDTMDEPVTYCSGGVREDTQSIPLLVGKYRLSLVLKDMNGDRIGTHTEDIQVGSERY